jgi:uncharacterized protein YqhQ
MELFHSSKQKVMLFLEGGTKKCQTNLFHLGRFVEEEPSSHTQEKEDENVDHPDESEGIICTLIYSFIFKLSLFLIFLYYVSQFVCVYCKQQNAILCLYFP